MQALRYNNLIHQNFYQLAYNTTIQPSFDIALLTWSSEVHLHASATVERRCNSIAVQQCAKRGKMLSLAQLHPLRTPTQRNYTVFPTCLLWHLCRIQHHWSRHKPSSSTILLVWHSGTTLVSALLVLKIKPLTTAALSTSNSLISIIIMHVCARVQVLVEFKLKRRLYTAG